MRTTTFYFLISLFASQAIISCVTEDKITNLPTIALNPHPKNNSFEFEEIFVSVEAIPLETHPDCILGGVSKLVENSKSLFVLDEKQNIIARFDMQGKFLNTIGLPGYGPGEFLKVKDFVIDKVNQLVSVYDVRGRKIIIYDFQGKFIREFKIEFFLHSIAIDENSDYYGFTGNIANKIDAKDNLHKKLKFIKFDKYGKVLKYITGHDHSVLHISFFEHISQQSDGTISFAEPLQYYLFRLNNDIITPYYLIDFKNYATPYNTKELLNKEETPSTEHQRTIFNEANKNYILGLIKFHENDEWIVIQYSINYKFQFAFFHKTSGEIFESSSLPVSTETKSTFFTPLYIDDHFIYSASSAFYLHERYNEDRNNKDVSNSRIKDWETFLININVEDNPVIFKYRMK
jgi:hypothetical protein